MVGRQARDLLIIQITALTSNERQSLWYCSYHIASRPFRQTLVAPRSVQNKYSRATMRKTKALDKCLTAPVEGLRGQLPPISGRNVISLGTARPIRYFHALVFLSHAAATPALAIPGRFRRALA